MFTFAYKGAFIHGYFHKGECKFHFEGERTTVARSTHAAKCAITRRLNSLKAAK